MSHSEKCPICKGRGKLFNVLNFFNLKDFRYGTDCYGCNGKGWITVKDEWEYDRPSK